MRVNKEAPTEEWMMRVIPHPGESALNLLLPFHFYDHKYIYSPTEIHLNLSCLSSINIQDV
jgi:hypothetical protein